VLNRDGALDEPPPLPPAVLAPPEPFASAPPPVAPTLISGGDPSLPATMGEVGAPVLSGWEGGDPVIEAEEPAPVLAAVVDAADDVETDPEESAAAEAPPAADECDEKTTVLKDCCMRCVRLVCMMDMGRLASALAAAAVDGRGWGAALSR